MTPPTYQSTIAYFSMEICLEQAIPTYSGGLGVLAGDTLRSAADLELPVVGITLLHRKGYFRQHLDGQGNQTEGPVEWHPEEMLQELPDRTTVQVEGRQVAVRAWRYSVARVARTRASARPANAPSRRAIAASRGGRGLTGRDDGSAGSTTSSMNTG